MRLRLGQRCRVRCICGDKHCLASASRGGATGEVVSIQSGLITVVLDGQETLGGLDFPEQYVRPEDA